MNFQNLSKIENHEFYLDVAFRRANKKIKELRQKIQFTTQLSKSKELEIARIQIIRDILKDDLYKILKCFPSINDLPIFYQELIKVTLDFPELKHSLGALNWAVKRIDSFFDFYKNKMKRTKDAKSINRFRREFNGRVSSLLKTIRKNLAYLEESRKIMKNYPTIKTSIFTVSIVGFPNVGKTTLLYKLTGSKPEINSYAFTTKNINISYIKENNKKIQILDTPGTLNRPEKMNNIEMQAYLAIKYCADMIVYIIDLTEPYPLDKQEKLLANLKKFDKKTAIYLSKADILEKEKIKHFKQAINNAKDLKKLLLHAYIEK